MGGRINKFTRILARITPAAEAIAERGRTLPELPASPPTFAETLAAAGRVSDRSGLATAWSGPTDDRIVASELTDAQIEHGVALRGAGLNTTDEKVAATMWLQWYCHRMAAPVMASWVLHRRVPDVSAGNIALRFDSEGRPAFVAMIEMRAAGLPGDHVEDAKLTQAEDLLPEIVRVLLDGHLLPLAERVRARYRLGGPITRGTVASQIGMALTAIDAHTTVPWERVAADALSLFDLTKPTIDGQGRSGDVVCTESCGRVGMTFRRGTCCLVYKTSGREKCGGCPLRTDEDRAGVYAERMSLRSEQFLV